MTFNKHAQSMLEYTLLVAIAISALVIGSNFISRMKRNSFDEHFNAASHYIGGGSYVAP